MDNIYFGQKPPLECAAYLDGKIGEWSQGTETSGWLEKLRSAYCAYHGAYYTDTSSGHQISFGGEQGELVNLPVNHFRNIAQHILVMTCSNRPAMQARATNTDYKSLVQTTLANNILDYYMREKSLEKYLKKATEYAIVFGAGWVTMQWNATKGEPVDHIEETDTTIYEGDIEFGTLSPFDICFDGTRETSDHDWIITRSWVNKFDLAAKYPEFADEIIKLQTKSDTAKFRMGVNNLIDQTDDVEVKEFFHKRTDCMPQGRYMKFLTANIVVEDMPLPYRVLPVFRISAGDIFGTPHGYTPMFDIMPLQEAVNSLYSTILSNQNAFGVQNILNPRGNDIAVNQLQGGLNVLDYSFVPGSPSGGKPEALNLTQTPQEVFNFLKQIEQTMETLSGVNSVARGNPEASLKSGTALALVQSMALQFMSGLQQSYVELVESVGSAIIKMLQDFANTPRLITIAGKANRGYMKEFSGQDISNIARVAVDVGNPMAQTTAGRVQMAQELIQYGEITPHQYVNVIETGNLEQITEDIVHENLLMRAENEAIMDGESPPTLFTDNHKNHIDYHRSLLFDPDLRKDADLIQRVQSHIQEHITQLRTVDPALLQVMGQQPLPPAAPPGPPPGAPQQGQPNGSPNGSPNPNAQGNPAQVMQQPPQGIQGPGIAPSGKVAGPGLPQNGQRLPNLPKVPASALPNPALQQQSLNNVKNK